MDLNPQTSVLETPEALKPFKTVTLQYFALFREERGCSEETWQTESKTVRALYEELQRRYAFKLSPGIVKVAVNGHFVEWDSPIAHGDQIVWIPPVAGG